MSFFALSGLRFGISDSGTRFSRCVGDWDLICSVWGVVVWCHVQRVHGLESRGSGLPAVDRLADLFGLDVGRSADNVKDLEAQDDDVLRVWDLGFRVEDMEAQDDDVMRVGSSKIRRVLGIGVWVQECPAGWIIGI
jgi:hypothetical protein